MTLLSSRSRILALYLAMAWAACWLAPLLLWPALAGLLLLAFTGKARGEEDGPDAL